MREVRRGEPRAASGERACDGLTEGLGAGAEEFFPTALLDWLVCVLQGGLDFHGSSSFPNSTFPRLSPS